MSDPIVGVTAQLSRLKHMRARQAERALAQARRDVATCADTAQRCKQALESARKTALNEEARLYSSLPGRPMADGRLSGIAQRLAQIHQTVGDAAETLNQSLDALEKATATAEHAQRADQEARRAVDRITHIQDTVVQPTLKKAAQRKSNAADEAGLALFGAREQTP